MSTESILTGEGVVLDAAAASFASRLTGALIDAVASAMVLYGGVLAIAALNPSTDHAAAIAATVLLATVLIIMPTAVETLSRGRSLGKLALGIRIVRDDGGAVTVRQALGRALVGVLELWLTLGVPALVSSIVNPRGKRLGDLAVGTYAVRLRGGPTLRGALRMPPALAGWARGADIARMPDPLALSARQFLARASRLHPTSRVELGTRLTEQVQRYVRPLPPPGTHPEAFLAAVLAERRDRELVVEQARHRRSEQDAQILERLPYGVPDPRS